MRFAQTLVAARTLGQPAGVHEGSTNRHLLLVALAIAAASTAHAQPQAPPSQTRDQLTFSVTRRTSVENDEMTVTLAASHTDLDAAAAADGVNRTMQQVLPRVRKAGGEEGVEFRTGSYSTNEVRPQPSPTAPPGPPRWRAQQELILTSRDFKALRALVTELQAKLALKSVGFGLSDARRIEKQREMNALVLHAFRAEAEVLCKTLGFSRYEIVELQLSSGAPEPFLAQSRYRAMGAAAPAPVVLEGGSSDVSATVQARIQLLR